MSLSGEDLKAFRKLQRVTQQGLSEVLGVSVNTIQMWERVPDGTVKGLLQNKFFSYVNYNGEDKLSGKEYSKYRRLAKEWLREKSKEGSRKPKTPVRSRTRKTGFRSKTRGRKVCC